MAISDKAIKSDMVRVQRIGFVVIHLNNALRLVMAMAWRTPHLEMQLSKNAPEVGSNEEQTLCYCA